jgi:tetratricopeptide (TPR) repeat protein
MQLALLFTAKHNPLAIQYFENAYRADSSDMEPLYGEAMFWQNQQKYAEAKQVFKRCILLNKDYERAYYNTGWMLLQEDSVEKSIRHFGMAIQVKQDYADAYYNRGLCYEILGKKDSAILDYKQALVFSPGLASCQTALQRIQHAKK